MGNMMTALHPPLRGTLSPLRGARGVWWFLVVILVASSAFADRRHAVRNTGVPAAYADLYDLLSAQLDAAQAQVAPLRPELRPQPIYAADLLPANANRGTDLLRPQAMDGVRAFLDRFQQLGIRGVVMTLGYPLLLDRFPNSAQYLQFYKQVVAEVRGRGMTVEIESSVLFANSAFSSISWDYSRTPFSQFVQERHDMISKIVTELAPDYLELGAEPDTEAKLTGYAQLNVPSVWAQSIGQIIAGIDRGSTKLGTGIGTWDPISFVDAEVQLGIDFIGLHIYPMDSSSMVTAFQAASMARAHGKPIVIDEAWLYKMRPGESTSIAGNATIFGRDAFDFFMPLDQRFLRFLDDFARAEGVTLISPFWSTYLFGYLPYSQATAALSYDQIVAQVNAIAATNIVKGFATPTGAYYGMLIGGRR